MTNRVLLDDPDFNCNEGIPNECNFVAGVRPYRNGTYRLEDVRVGTKLIVHNYGHGGAGITMSWGCTDVVRSIVTSKIPITEPIAILGAGVMGLTAAVLLRQVGYHVSIYAAKFTGTTSDVAGGQWAPSIVAFNSRNAAAKKRFEDILRTAHRMHSANIGPVFGVSPRTNYTVHLSPSFAKVPVDVIRPPTKLAHLPFSKLNRSGYAYSTLLVEPPIFLKKLRSDLAADPHVACHVRTFQNLGEVQSLDEACIVNCTGFGAKKLFNDPAMKPIKGQLALVKAQPNLQYLLSTGATYVFPRSDHVVVGGSQEDVDDEIAEPGRCRAILQMARNVFNGTMLMRDQRESWMLKNK